ncbi:MAG: alpha-L-fucosidase [Luteolibacter sp.]|nr:alpha-L-fucosidase [Luteolibacter sp.]
MRSLPIPTAMLLCLALHAAAEPPAKRLLPDAKETPRIQAWRNLHYGMFLHFGMTTFTGIERDPGNQPSTTYAPENPDPDQWVRVARDAGMKYAVLTSKHVSGHCLWDSKVTFRGKEFDYDVATSSNKTDVIRAFADACGKHGVLPGLYYCLIDYRNNPLPDDKQQANGLLPDDFFHLAKDQLTELSVKYPEIRYYWLDIPSAASAEQRAELYDMLRRRDPGLVVLFNYGMADQRKPDGLTVETSKGASWPTDILNSERETLHKPFNPEQSWQGSPYFLGYEHCDVIGEHWFWTSNDKARSTDKLFELYDETVNKAGGNLLLDVGPGRDGKLHDWQIEALMKLKAMIKAEIQ